MRHGTTTEVWRVRLAAISGASGHEWAMGKGVVDGMLWVSGGLTRAPALPRFQKCELCPVKVAKAVHSAVMCFAPVGANPDSECDPVPHGAASF